MKNMGLGRLRVVAPEGEIDEAVVRARAVHAADLWDGAERYATAAEATADCSLVAGTTRRRGKKRKSITLTPWELGEALRDRPGPAAILFGNERTGLTADELSLCNLASHIPVDEAFPSLNLSHAVQIYAYELHRLLGEADSGRWVPVDARRLDETVRRMTDALASVGFYKQAGREDQERFFRDLLSRAGPTVDEVRYLEGIFSKMARLADKREL